jgi:F-type H+-transporting ATPase subunit a
MNSPLESTLVPDRPVPITQAVVTTWVIMAVLVLGGYLLTRRIETIPGKRPGRTRTDRRHARHPDP